MTAEGFRGFASRHVVARLACRSALRGARVALSRTVHETLPDVAAILRELGCDVDQHAGDERLLTLGLGDPTNARLDAHVRIEVAPVQPAGAGGDFTIAALHGFALVARRRVCDYLVWQHLFDERAPLALAGRVLILDQYCDLGRVVAYRARGLGMVVQVDDRDPLRRLEARCDGFDIWPVQAEYPNTERAVVVRIADLLEQSHDVAGLALVHGIEDEVGATSIVALAVLHRQLLTVRVTDQRAWRAACDPLVYDALLRADDNDAAWARVLGERTS